MKSRTAVQLARDNPLFNPILGRIRAAPGSATNTQPRGLTRSLDVTKEGLAMNATRTCSVQDCSRAYWSRGYCSRHYAQWRRRASEEEKAPKSASDRFWAKVEVRSALDCWYWSGAITPQGYGNFWDGTEFVGAHRFSFAQAKGDPGALVVDHACHNRSACTDAPCRHRRCVNPDHLESVPQAVNSVRGRTGAHNRGKTHCAHGHEFSAVNTIWRKEGGRTCRACKSAYQAKYNRQRGMSGD